MADVGTLISAAKTLAKLRAFVFEGGLAELVSDIELSAAHDALVKSSLARDPKSQLWTAIGHLESALHATLKSAETAQKQKADLLIAGPWPHQEYVDALKERAQYISCMMAAAYLTLEDRTLCKRQLAMLDEIEKAAPGSDVWALVGHITSVLPPLLSLMITLPKTKKVGPRMGKEQKEELVKTFSALADQG